MRWTRYACTASARFTALRGRLVLTPDPASLAARSPPHGQAGHQGPEIQRQGHPSRCPAREHDCSASEQGCPDIREAAKAVQALEADQTRQPRPLGRFIEVDEVRVHYIARGKGRPMV